MTLITPDSGLRYGTVAIATLGLLASAACSSSGGGSKGSSSSASNTASSSSSSSSGSSAGHAPSSSDLTNTLIGGADIPADTFTLKSADPVNSGGATGVDGEFANADASRKVTDVLLYFPTTAGAATALAAELTAGKAEIVSGLTDNTVSAGTGGHIFQGNDSHGAATIVLFQEGNYVVTLEFTSPAGDDIPADLASGVADAQDSKIKAAS